MDLSKTPAELATEAAEALRALNHRTLDSKAYTAPPAVGDTAHGIRTLIERLPQTLDQMNAALLRLDVEKAIRMDDGTDPEVAVAVCEAALRRAQLLTDDLLKELSIVSARTSHMGGQWDAADDE
ncbi:hypothetical protein [Streptomyces sp. NPDC127084]|uniref:hypothetical protein n=1 Tax=Streptomyces sp. NPDC127084 TaxID=3347133 RepID=UPI0036688467